MKKPLFSFLLCLAAGSASSLAMAPLNAWPIFFITLGAFYAGLARSTSIKQAFFLGWGFGFGYFLFGLSWIGNALLVEGNPYAWAWPIAVSGLPFALAFFYGFAALIIKKFSDLKTVAGYLSFAAIFVLTEWLRGHIFTGFPWNLFGYSWVDIQPVIQITSLGSVYFLTWLTILWASIGGFWIVQERPFIQKLIVPALLALSFAGVYAFGSARINSYATEYHDGIEIKIVQPNIPQHEKWDRAKMTENFFKLLRLSYPETENGSTTYVIWPETALNYHYANDETSMNLIRQMLASYQGDAYLFTGLLRQDADSAYGNSIVMINKSGEISNIYDKHHLVPFGEYIPFQKWLPFGPIAQFSGFKKGRGAQSMSTPDGLSYSPLVCYEAIFPGKVVNPLQKRPDFLLNTTNDAWYGDSAGPRQHFAQTIFRAVEEGIPLIRAANTGISALIAPTGQVIHRAALFKESNQRIKLPKKLFSPAVNNFSKNAIFFIMVFVSLGFTQILRIILKTRD